MQPQSSLSQGLTLIEAVTERERSGRGGFIASRLAEHTGLERSRVSRLTQELSSLGYLEKDDVQAFRPGPASFALAATRNEPWLREARTELRALASAHRVSSRVSVRSAERVILLRYETGVGSVDGSIRPGMVTPAWCTGAGRALLWDHAEADLERLFHGVEFVGVGGPGAARTIPEVHLFQERDRDAGVVAAREEFEQAVTEWAMPIRDATGRIIAALSVTGPALTAREESSLIKRVQVAAERLSARAGQPD